MRILHIGKFCPPKEGGIEIFSFDLLESLNKKGVEADLLCYADNTTGYYYKSFRVWGCKQNIKISSAPFSLDFIKIFKSIEGNYDLIHLHSPNPLGEILSIISKKDIIIHWHSDIVRQKILYKFYKSFQQSALKKAKRIVVTSHNYLDTSQQIKNFKNKVVVIPLGLNPDKFNKMGSYDEKFEAIRDKIKGRKVVLAVGRIVEYKGFEYLVEAGKYLNSDTVIIIIGGGSLYEELENKIKKLNIEKKVHLVGRVESINAYMKNCDVFCLPSISRNEAFGLVLVEALYFGKPLVTTNVEGSGMNYVNIHNKTGLVVPPKNPKALAEALNRILSDMSLYRNFGENAKRRFEEFHIDNISDRIIDVYKDIVNEY